MSLVQVFLRKQYLLACSDSRAINKKSTSEDEEYKKIFQFGHCVILCLTGDVDDNVELFSDYLYRTGDGKIDKKNDFNHDYVIFQELIDKRFDQLGKSPKKQRLINSLLCGWDGTCFAVRKYHIKGKSDPPETVYPYENDSETRIITCENEHTNHQQVTEKYGAGIIPSAENMQFVFQKSLDDGIKSDDTINNIMQHKLLTIADLKRFRII